MGLSGHEALKKAASAAFVAREFGAEVDYWITLNEPFAVVLPGYLMPTTTRVNPPGLTLRTTEARAVLVTMIEAHAKMYDALQGGDKIDADGDGAATRIGIAYSVSPVAPKDPDDALDVRGAKDLSYLLNEVFFEAICAGKLDRGLDRKPETRPDLARLDLIGINYYEEVKVDGVATAPFPTLSPLFTVNPFTLTHTGNLPRGIYDSWRLLRKYNKPVIITENGNVDDKDDGSTSTYLVRHLFWLRRAMDEGGCAASVCPARVGVWQRQGFQHAPVPGDTDDAAADLAIGGTRARDRRSAGTWSPARGRPQACVIR